MSVKNITVSDIALVELLESGKTDAPPSKVAELQKAGYVQMVGGELTLTGSGLSRAQSLQRIPDLRRMFSASASGGVQVLTTDGGCTMHVGGGLARIRR
jgi:hypothetical protein